MPFYPSLGAVGSAISTFIAVEVATGAETATLAEVNQWTLVAPTVSVTLPDEGSVHLVHIDRFHGVTWPVGTEIIGATEGVEEAWVSLVYTDDHWTVFVPSAGGGGDGLPEGVSFDMDYAEFQIRSTDTKSTVYLSPYMMYLRESYNGGPYTEVAVSPTEFYGYESIGVGGEPILGFKLTRDRFTAVTDTSRSTLAFPNTGPDEQVIATQEWSAANLRPLPLSVATPAVLANHLGGIDGATTLVVSIGKPVWKLGATFVDSSGVVVYPVA